MTIAISRIRTIGAITPKMIERLLLIERLLSGMEGVGTITPKMIERLLSGMEGGS